MTLKKVISGGQTGADRTGLECAKALGLETGGWIPRGCRTEDGLDPSLLAFGCVEHRSPEWAPRTIANVEDAEATVWFGNKTSPGGRLTEGTCNKLGKPFFDNPDSFVMLYISQTYETINVAGNRKSKNPKVVGLVQAAFEALKP